MITKHMRPVGVSNIAAYCWETVSGRRAVHTAAMGSRYASVLPLPGSARACTSRPASSGGQHLKCKVEYEEAGGPQHGEPTLHGNSQPTASPGLDRHYLRKALACHVTLQQVGQ